MTRMSRWERKSCRLPLLARGKAKTQKAESRALKRSKFKLLTRRSNCCRLTIISCAIRSMKSSKWKMDFHQNLFSIIFHFHFHFLPQILATRLSRMIQCKHCGTSPPQKSSVSGEYTKLVVLNLSSVDGQNAYRVSQRKLIRPRYCSAPFLPSPGRLCGKIMTNHP